MGSQARHLYEFGPFRLDPARLRLFRGRELMALSRKDIETLLILVRHEGQTLSREELMRAVWGEAFVEDANLTVAISHLRRALGQNGEDGYIETIPRVGYCFSAAVREIREERPPLILEKHTVAETIIEEEILPDKSHPAVGPESATIESFSAIVPVVLRRRRTQVLAVAASLALVLGGIVYFSRASNPAPSLASSTAPVKSLAILPPRNVSPGVDNSALRLGLADALITKFSDVHKVSVRPTSTVSRYLTSNQNALDVGRKLGVDAVLDGTLHEVNGRVILTLNVFDVRSSKTVWTGNFEESNTELFKLHDAIAQQVAAALKLELTAGEQHLLAKRPTANHDAYVAYLKGNYYWSKRGVEVLKSIEHFGRAIELDPSFAQAYVGLARVHATSANWAEAQMLIEKALQLDNDLAEAHATYGFIRMFHNWDWAGAGAAFDRAVKLNPDSANAHHWRGVYLSLIGRLDEAKTEMHRALDLDPLSLIVMADIGQLHYFAREYDQAIEFCNRALALDSEFQMALVYLSHIYRMKLMENESIEMKLRAAPKNEVKAMKQAFERGGQRGVCQYELKRSRDSRVLADAMSPLHAAGLSLCLDNKEESMRYLELAFNEHVFLLPFINVDPGWDPLRENHRFQSIVQQMGLSAPRS